MTKCFGLCVGVILLYLFIYFLVKYLFEVILTVSFAFLPPPPFLLFDLPYAVCLLARSVGIDDISIYFLSVIAHCGSDPDWDLNVLQDKNVKEYDAICEMDSLRTWEVL